MLSVLIETRNDEEGLARTLAALVGAAVEGVVRDVVVCDLGSTDQTHRVAEHAGCHFVGEGGLASGLGVAKGEWLLLLEPGARPAEGWIESALEHMSRTALPARLTRSRVGGASFLLRLMSARRALSGGLLIKKTQAAALARPGMTAEALARGLRVKRLTATIRLPVPKSRR